MARPKKEILRERFTEYLNQAVTETLDAYLDKAWGAWHDGSAFEQATFIQDTMIGAVKRKCGDVRETLCAIGGP